MNFRRVLEFLDRAGISTLHYLQLAELAQGTALDARFPRTQIAAISVGELKKMEFWKHAQ